MFFRGHNELGRIADVLFIVKIPVLRNRRLSAFSLILMFRQTSLIVRIRLVSASTNMYSPSDFSALHSVAILSPASCERPTKKTRGWQACLANCFSEGLTNITSGTDEDGDKTARRIRSDARI